MDLSCFSDENFDSDEWLAKICDSEEARRPSTEDYMTNVLSILQSRMQQLNSNLEEQAGDIMGHMSKVFRDTQVLEQEAEDLKDKMKFVKEELDKLENNSGKSLYVLEELNKMKEELINQTESLKEADNWLTLSNEVEDVFESGNINDISLKLYNMQKSLSMLLNAADYEDKKLQLESLKNRLEAIASPKLVQAFTAGNFEQSLLYVEIFTKMDRLPQLLKYYHNCLKVSLAQDWRKTIEFAQDENIIFWLRTYFDKLLTTWQAQIKWFEHVFKIPSSEVLVNIYTDLLKSLDPGIPECIEAALRQQNNSTKLEILIELKDITKHFLINLKGLVDKVTKENKLKLAQTLYTPFITYIAKYGVYENSNLTQQLNALQITHDELSDTVNSLSISVSKVMEYANKANDRCKQFTEGCAYPNFVKTINTFFGNYLEKFKAGMRQLNKCKVKHEDWKLFQTCLTLMQTIGDFLILIEELEKNLVSDILLINNKLENPDANVFNQYKLLFLNDDRLNEFQKLISSIETEKSLLSPTKKLVQKLCSDLHQSIHEVIFAPIFTQLMLARKAPAWSQETNKMAINFDLPDYSYAPQEYITQVGQYLMTLPQHLEPFLLRDNPCLTKALKLVDSQYCQESCESGFTNVLLSIIAKKTCQMFQDQTWGIHELNSVACKQLATDIDYLENVLEELGLTLSENLKQMSLLLRVPAEEYQNRCSGCNPKVVAAVRQMRNITSSG